MDHYVINKQNSQFVYCALSETSAFCLKRQYLHNVIFTKYPDFYTNASMASYSYYKKWIWKPIRQQRRDDLEQSNQARYLFNQLYLKEKFGGKKEVPTR